MTPFSSSTFHDLSDGTIEIPFPELLENLGYRDFVLKSDVTKKWPKKGPKFLQSTALLSGGSTIMDVIYETKGKFPTKLCNHKRIETALEGYSLNVRLKA